MKLNEHQLTSFVAEMNATNYAFDLWKSFRNGDVCELETVIKEVVKSKCTPLKDWNFKGHRGGNKSFAHN